MRESKWDWSDSVRFLQIPLSILYFPPPLFWRVECCFYKARGYVSGDRVSRGKYGCDAFRQQDWFCFDYVRPSMTVGAVSWWDIQAETDASQSMFALLMRRPVCSPCGPVCFVGKSDLIVRGGKVLFQTRDQHWAAWMVIYENLSGGHLENISPGRVWPTMERVESIFINSKTAWT